MKSHERNLVMEKVEFLVLRNLLHNEQYVRKVIPFIKSEYFEDSNQKVIFEEILKNTEKYFTEEVMQQLDQIARKEFSYGES